MSSDEVRLWREDYGLGAFGWRLDAPPLGPCRPLLVDAGVWLPLARHAALMRVVDAAVAAAPDWLPDDIGAATEAVVANAQRIALGLVRLGRAITATAPRRQGEAPR